MPPPCPGLPGSLFVGWGRFLGSCLEVSTSALASFMDYSLIIPLRSPRADPRATDAPVGSGSARH